MRAHLGLTLFESPLAPAWVAEQSAVLSVSEQSRLSLIERPLRREQFVVGHRLLRLVLAQCGLHDVRIEVDPSGKLVIRSNAVVYASVAHSGNAVAVGVCGSAIGIDLEASRVLADPSTAAALVGTTDASNSGVLHAWTTSEARLKAGHAAQIVAWRADWQDCLLAVSGVSHPPLTGVFEVMAGTYNPIELRWEQV